MRHYFEQGNMFPMFLMASAILAVGAMVGVEMLPQLTAPDTTIRIEPATQRIETGKTFVVNVIVDSEIPVNVFGGELRFNKDVLAVDAISYNTSIADLWAIRPWYSNGDGTLNFGGGTTKQGGFTGSDTLLTVTFKTISEGSGSVTLNDIQILQSDGLGTRAAVGEPIDALFTIIPSKPMGDESTQMTYFIASKIASTDLNGDGKQSVADLSIFMLDVTTQKDRSDFNADGTVDTKDLSILLSTK